MKDENGDAEIAGQEEQGKGELGRDDRIEPDARIEPLAQENAQLREMLRIRDARDEITDALRAAGARSPGLLFAGVVGDLQFDADGHVANSAALVEKMKRTYPEQFGRDAAATRIDAGAGGASQARYLTKEMLAKMKPAEIGKLDWADVRSVLSEK